MNELQLEIITPANQCAFDRLIQAYEAEFSSITEKLPGPDGIFPLDTHLDDTHFGYLAYLGDIPVGFNVIATKGIGHFEVCEFYIIPVCRMKKRGYDLAAQVFDRHPGHWEVKQIVGADQAYNFWRKAIGQYTRGKYTDDVYRDEYWGKVTRQTFNSLQT